MPETCGNAASYFVDRHRSGSAGAKAAFVEAGPAGRTLTYESLALQSDRMAALYERHGLQPEDRAAMLVLDQIEFPVIFWGSLKAGVIPIPVNTLLSAEAYRAILMDCRARALFVSGQLLPAIEPALDGNPYLKAIFAIAAAGGRNGSTLPGPGARPSRLDWLSQQKPPHPATGEAGRHPLPQGERVIPCVPSPPPLADAVMLSCELAEASSPGEGQDEGAFVAPAAEVCCLGRKNAKVLDFGAELAASERRDLLAASPDECAFWLYSSGSTGAPKGVRHVHGNLKFTADTYGRQVLGIQPGDIVFSAAKMFFAFGLGNAMTFPMSVGATTILLPGRPTVDSVTAVIQETSPTVFCGVPTLYAAMAAALEGARPEGAGRLRRCISAGEALPAEVGARWAKIFGVDILDGVGSTELLHIFLSNRPGDVVLGTSGTAVPGYELRLVDEQGNPVSPGGIGELLVNGGSAAADYWNQREQSRTTFEGLWTRTGDKYLLREDGRFAYCGRTDDIFKVSGIWVAPFEVEQALISHPSVLEAAVVPLQDADGLEKPKAYVVLKNGVKREGLAEALKDHVKAKIGKWKYPRWIDFVEELPKTATGKIQRFKLRTAQRPGAGCGQPLRSSRKGEAISGSAN